MVLILTAGTAFVMWLAELITQRGIGQGMSILIFANVVAAIPTGFKAIYEEGGIVQVRDHHARLAALAGRHRLHGPGPAAHPGHLRHAGSWAGACTGAAATYIPLKVNQSGVIPIIFASSVLYIPVLLSNVIPWHWFQNFVRNSLTPDELLLHRGVLRAHRDVHVLLRLRRLRPPPAGRPDPQAGWVRPGHPAGAPDRAVLRAHPQPHHRRRRALPRLGRRGARRSSWRSGTSTGSPSTAPPC